MKSLSLFAGVVLGLIALAQPAPSQTTVMSDNFNGYANDAALLGAWTRPTGTSADISLAADPDPANLHGQCIFENTTAARLRYTLSSAVAPSAANSLVLAFDMYDVNGGTTSGRTYIELRNSLTTAGLFDAGIYNVTATGTYAQGAYQARDIDNGGWIQLSTARSVGWHHFELTIKPTTASLTIDGTAVPELTDRTWNGGTSYDWINLGSGISSLTGTYFDNISLTLTPVPEPSVFALGLLGGLGLVVRGILRPRNV